jgi:ATP adenylyltransferase
MNVLWAPWREQYVVKSSNPSKKDKCVFCAILKERKDRKNLIFQRSEHCFAVLNIYPFNGGHSLVIPNRHVEDLSQLSAEELKDLMEMVIRVKEITTRAIVPHAFNVGMNLGHIAGAGIPHHLHVHIVPRWKGDVNFMPAVFETKVMPVALGTVYKKFKEVT